MLENVLVILASTPEKLQRELRDVPAREEAADARQWSIQEILAHLADVKKVGMRERVEAIISEDRPMLDPFDQEKRAVELRYDRIDPQDVAGVARQASARPA